MKIQSSNKTIRKLDIKDLEQTAALISNALDIDKTYSWSKALGINRSLEPYMLSYLPVPLNFTIGSYGQCDSENPNNIHGVVILEELIPRNASTPTVEPPAETSTAIDGTNEIGQNSEDVQPEVPENFGAIEAILVESENIFYSQIDTRNKLTSQLIKINSNTTPTTHTINPSLYPRNGKYLYVAWIATHPNYRQQGIASRLLGHISDLMIQHDYDYAMAICSHPGSSRIFEANGYVSWGEIKYTEFTYNGKTASAFLLCMYMRVF